MLRRVQPIIAFLVLLCGVARAGGPAYVAGASYFDPATKGMPITWAQGAISYYTDQGDLSSNLPGPNADAFVAASFNYWTSISTAAVSATRSGQLAEDVDSTNLTLTSMPADILPSATGTPVGIVYDVDGSITDALLGTGASGPTGGFLSVPGTSQPHPVGQCECTR